MSTDRVTTSRESVPTCWTELDELFFTLVCDVLNTSFLWGAATLLASYDPDELPVEKYQSEPYAEPPGSPSAHAAQQQRDAEHGRPDSGERQGHEPGQLRTDGPT